MIFIGYTAQSLRKYINEFGNKNGLEVPFPNPVRVDHVTFANVVAYLIDLQAQHEKEKGFSYAYPLGPNNGILFKGIELVPAFAYSDE